MVFVLGNLFPVSQLKSYTKTKLDSDNRNSNSNSDNFYSVKPKVSKKIKLKTEKEKKQSDSTENIWDGPLNDTEVSGDILKKPKQKYKTLSEAKEVAKKVNKDGIKYDSIVKLNDNYFQIRKAKKADRKKDRSLWVIDTEKDRIMATMPTKPKTIKIKSMKSVKAPISGKDSIWDGPIENTEASKIDKSKDFSFNTLEEAKQKAIELGEEYNAIVEIRKKFKLRKIRRIGYSQGRILWIRKSAKKNFNL